MADNKEKKAEQKEKKAETTWFMAERDLNLELQMECIEHDITNRGDRRTVPGTKNHVIKFKNGLFETDKAEEIEFLENHPLAGEMASPMYQFHKCTKEEADNIKKLKEIGIKREQWHERLGMLAKAMIK